MSVSDSFLVSRLKRIILIPQTCKTLNASRKLVSVNFIEDSLESITPLLFEVTQVILLRS